jgi:DNA-binding NarL/FixJ family response regulator
VIDDFVLVRYLTSDAATEPMSIKIPREREVLSLMAEGRSNAGIAAALVISAGVVEKHVASIFGKLRLPPAEGDNRRVLAVLRFLGS